MVKSDYLARLIDFYLLETHDNHPLKSLMKGLNVQQSESLFTILSLINAPGDGQCILHMRPVIELLVKAFEDEAGIPEHQEFRKDLDVIFSRVANLAKRNVQLKKTSVHSKKETFPIYSFLFLTCVEGGASRIWKGELSPQFIALAPFLIRRIRFIKQRVNKVPKLYIYDLALIARKLVVGSKELSPISTFAWSDKTKRELASDAMAFQLVNDESLMTESSYSYVMDILFRNREEFEERAKSRRFGISEERIVRWMTYERQPSKTYQADAEFEIEDDCFEPKPDSESGVIRASIHSSCFGGSDSRKVRKLIHEAGEFDVDYQNEVGVELPSSWWKNPYLAKLGTRGKVEALTYATRIQPWDKTCLSEQMIRRILLCSIAEKEPWMAVIMLGLLMNLGVKSIEKIKVAVAPSCVEYTSEEIAKIKKGQIFVDIANGILWGPSFLGESSQEDFYLVSLFSEIKLPDQISRHLSKVDAEQQLLFNDIDILRTKHFIRDLGVDGVSNVTFSRLTKTFRGYFIGGSGFPELYADILKFNQSMHLNSQHYYISYCMNHFKNEWHRMIDAFEKGILQEQPVEEILANMKFQVNEDILQERVQAGARKTPTLNALRKHFETIKKCFPHTSSELLHGSVDQWNAYMAYLYGFYAVTIGQRPLRDPIAKLNNISLMSQSVFIPEEKPVVFTNSRKNPLSENLKKALRIHLRIHPKMVRNKLLSGYHAEVELNSFFLIDEGEKALVPVSPENIDRLLGDYCGEGYLHGIKNGFRHFVLTALHHHGSTQLLIDWFSGHRHFGMEPEHITSPMKWSDAAANINLAIQETVVSWLKLEAPFEV